MENELESMFYISDGKGFQITFSNGFTASVQFGEFNYCEYYLGLKKPKIRKKGKNAHSRDAEVACFDKDGNLISLEGYDKERVDKVIGFLTANEVLDFMNWVANLPPDYAEQLNKNEQEKTEEKSLKTKLQLKRNLEHQKRKLQLLKSKGLLALVS